MPANYAFRIKKNGMTTARYFLIILLPLFISGSCLKLGPKEKINYKQEMREFVQEISNYAKGINPDFVIIPQNGVELVSKTGEIGGQPATAYLEAIDGIGQEDLFYGYHADDEPTPASETDRLIYFLDLAKNHGRIKILVTDYCSTHAKIDDSYRKNNAKSYISFAADHRELDHIPTYPNPIYHENTGLISRLQEAKNFLYLINPDNEFPDKQTFIQAVRHTNYDVLITDLFFNGEPFSPSQVEELRTKANGGKRLLICYISIGEAEDYRYYWQPDWRVGHPSFIVKENPDWEGNYIVKYWEDAWKNIIFGHDGSYIKKILDAGFDGAYLDIIDAFEQFED